MNYQYFELLKNKSIHTKWKALDRGQHLSFLNDNCNKYYAPLFCHLFGSNIKKIIPSHVKTIKGNKTIYENYVYGHLIVGNNPIRLSTNLDLKNNSIQFPIEEYSYFSYGKYLFFTCGDLYLIVSCSKLQDCIESKTIMIEKTALKNYEISIIDLFNNNIIENFGLLDINNLSVEKDDGTSAVLSNTLSQTFLNTKLRGCLIGQKPKYIVARIENSNSDLFFELFFFMNRKDIRKMIFRNTIKNIKTDQGIGLIIKYHTNNILSEIQEIRQSSLIKTGKNFSYAILNYNKVNNIHKIKQYCQKYLLAKPPEKEYCLHWAVKKSIYCNSKEEYNYYKQLFISCNGKKNKYTEEDIYFFKDCFSYKKYISKSSDHFYK